MLFRITTLAAISAALIFTLHREEKRGGLERVNRVFLDWLIANSSEQLQEPALTFLTLTDVEASIFESWPPAPLDYAVILKNLERYHPGVTAIVPTLGWRTDDQVSTGALRTQLLRAPRLLLGCVLQDNPVPSALPPGEDPARFLEAVPGVGGDIAPIPRFTGLLTLPEEAFLPGAGIAFTHIDLGPDESAGALAVPLLARRGDTIVPSFILKAILLQQDRAVEDLVIQLGDAILIGGTDIRIPIDRRGYLTIYPGIRDRLPRVDAGALFLADSPELGKIDLAGDANATAILEALEDNAVLLIGEDHPGARQVPLGKNERVSRAELLAMAIATVQSRRYISRSPAEDQYALWAAIFLVGIALLRLRRGRIFGFSLLLLMLTTIISMFLFQSSLTWMPPAIPFTLILATLLLGLILPGSPAVDKEPAEEEKPDADLDKKSEPPISK